MSIYTRIFRARPSGGTLAALLVGVVSLAVAIVISSSRQSTFVPHLRVVTQASVPQENVETVFLFNPRRDPLACDRLVTAVNQGITAACKQCTVIEAQCLTELSSTQRAMVSERPISAPSARLPDGHAMFSSTDPAAALAACQESEGIARKSGSAVTCYPPNVARPALRPATSAPPVPGFPLALIFLSISALVSCLACYLLLRFEHMHAHLSHDDGEGPQKFHTSPTPRIGGMCLLIGILTVGAVLVPLEQRFDLKSFALLVLASLPAFAGGFAEDITKSVGVTTRLLLTMLAAVIGVLLLDATLARVNIPGFDVILGFAPFAIVFTIFAVGGVANSINIIDGYNGLAAGYSAIVLAGLAAVGYMVADQLVVSASLTMLGAIAGFLVWNYPRGRLFLGDGGAYFIGFWIAELSVLLVTRNPAVSPWFPLLLLGYPIFETIFSIYRRQFVRGHHPGHPDSLHMHQLIYMRLARVSVGSRDSIEVTRRNSLVAIYIWPASVFLMAIAVAFWNQTHLLQGGILAFCLFYMWLYHRMVHWRAPAWLMLRRRSS